MELGQNNGSISNCNELEWHNSIGKMTMPTFNVPDKNADQIKFEGLGAT